MAPKNSKANSKKAVENEGDPGYVAKRERNNEVSRLMISKNSFEINIPSCI